MYSLLWIKTTDANASLLTNKRKTETGFSILYTGYSCYIVIKKNIISGRIDTKPNSICGLCVFNKKARNALPCSYLHLPLLSPS